MQYAPTAYRKKRPLLPIYLGALRKEKEKRVEGRIPVCRGAKAYAPQTIREDRMIESKCLYLSPFGNRRRPAGTLFRP